MIYDIIGDIHGQGDKLIGLLDQLGYTLTTDKQGHTYYQPPENHRAIFIGDLIDRGGQEVKTLQTVFAMLDADVADAVMGNHEYNALAFSILNETANDGSYLRTHNGTNIKQHQAFLTEVPFQSEEHRYWLKRFYELPLWLEKEDACFVHACWDSKSMEKLSPYLTDNNCLTEAGVQATGQEHSPAYDALERVLKGVESELPNNLYFVDKYGIKRYNIRVKWWQDNLNSRPLHEIARIPSADLEQLKTISPDTKRDFINFELDTNKPIFIGHYWLTGTPEPLSKHVVCVDYSAASDNGFLTCYQLDTENTLPLNKDNFLQHIHN